MFKDKDFQTDKQPNDYDYQPFPNFEDSTIVMKVFVRLLFVFVMFLLAGNTCLAQTLSVKGRVTDAETGEALAFVSVVAGNRSAGTITDIDGKFSLQVAPAAGTLKFSLVGYETQTLKLPQKADDMRVKLQSVAVELPVVEIRPGVNPALRIIRQVTKNRMINDYEQLPAFRYTSYEKTFFGPESDSIPYIASMAADSSYMRSREFFARQHLFLMENVTERSFRYPGQNYKRVIASKVSGLSDPLFVFLVSELQTASFYKDEIRLGEKEYVNPIAEGSLKRYHFVVRDTLIEPLPYDTTFIISFWPMIGSKFNALQGTLSVSTNGYAIRSVSANPVDQGDAFSIRIQQLYDFIGGSNWFPTQLNTDLVFNKARIVIDKSLNASMIIVGKGRNYISNIDLNPDLTRKNFGLVDTEVASGAYTTSEKEWNRFRADSLSRRERETYRVIDSIGKASHFDKMSKRLNALFNANLDMGLVNLSLAGLIKHNQYEGIRTAVKLSTSDRLIRWLQLSGYGAYGFKDKILKYGAGITTTIYKPRNTFISITGSDDLVEAGAGNPFPEAGHLLNPVKFREILIEKVDRSRILKFEFNTLLLRYLDANLHLSRNILTPDYSYRFLVKSTENISILADRFDISQIGITLRYAYGEKIIKNGKSVVTRKSTYPVSWFNYARGICRFAGGNINFNRIDLRVSKTFTSPFFGTTAMVIQAGAVTAGVPFQLLYTTPASYANFALYSPQSFTTMRINEFTSDRFMALFLSHNIGSRLLRTPYFRPEPEVVVNAGVGWLRNAQLHNMVHLKAYEKGYFESGLILNNLVDLRLIKLGIGGLYRIGPYSLPLFKQNIAVKLALQFIID